MNSGIRTYHEVDELPSDLPGQMAAQDERVSARLASVARVVAVMSGKGGVGKSLISALLATAMARRGRRVGLIDADLNGPSVPRLLGIERETLVEGSDGLEPPTSAAGVRAMLPYVDSHRPVHDLDSLASLADAIGGRRDALL
jgi:ATP-binding protein involved in chromosome partitioning